MIGFVLQHFRLATHAALLFAAGLFASWPVAHYRLRWAAWLPERITRFVLLLIGPRPSILRMTGVIFAFNSTVMFLQMASGYHPFFPKLLGVWTGLNVGIMTAASARKGIQPDVLGVPEGGWIPPRLLTLLCGVAVLALELPSYWFALAMGMSLGHNVQAAEVSYGDALLRRAAAYLAIIVPALLLSAIAESTAIRGSAASINDGSSSRA